MRLTSFMYCVTLFFSLTIFSQEKEDIEEFLKNDLAAYEETVFTHLNKSTYIKGEEIGFTSYLFNKETKKPTKFSTNLYCVITDNKDKIIKSKLLKIEDGVASGSFKIDSVFTTGAYKVKSYTNWMLNFDANNYYSETIHIIDTKKPEFVKNNLENTAIDLQFLSESGTLLNNTLNTVGIIAKKASGYGAANLSGKLFENDVKLLDFKLNKLGIGRMSFTPIKGKKYTAAINYNGEKIEKNISKLLKEEGIIIKVNKNEESVFMSLITNKKTLANIKKDTYYLLLNYGKIADKIKINFNKDLIVTKSALLKNLPFGVNVVSLVKEDNTPVAERVFFNHHKLEILNAEELSVTKEKDSINISLKIINNNLFENGNVSISVLPENTASYSKNATIISQTLLQPYLNSFIENGAYYFNAVDKQKKYDLDNLLITQGWSSYDWNTDKLKSNNFINDFERGISIKVNVQEPDKKSSYLIHHLSNNYSKILDFKEKIKSFQVYSYFPENDEKLYVSEVKKNTKIIKPIGLYMQYYPSHIPTLRSNFSTLQPKFKKHNLSENNNYTNFYDLNEATVLDEVVIEINQKKLEYEEIRNKSMGRVFFLEDIDRNITLADFLSFKPGIAAYDNYSEGVFSAFNKVGREYKKMAVYLDGNLVIDSFTLFNFFLYDVEYIEINKSDFSGGIAHGDGGTIRIKTDRLRNINKRESVSEFDFPLTFSKNKRFYVPIYQNFKSDFYNKYGVIDWLPINKLEKDGTIKIRIKDNLQHKIKLFLEGVTSNGEFISKELTVNLSN